MDKDFEITGLDFECTSCKKINNEARRIPVARVIEKLDSFFTHNDLEEAERLLDYWRGEAVSLGDKFGEVSIVNEMLGLTRRMGKKEKGISAIERALELLSATGNEKTISGATILLNAATTAKAFGDPERALLLYQRTLAIYESEGLDKNDGRYSAFYNNLATTLVDIRRYEEAKDAYEKALKITSLSPATILDGAITNVNMAHLFEAWHGLEAKEITEVLEKAQVILNSNDVERNAYYAFVCEKCAPSFDYYGYFFFAEELKERAKSIYEGA